jgi:hypothetical protein
MTQKMGFVIIPEIKDPVLNKLEISYNLSTDAVDRFYMNNHTDT